MIKANELRIGNYINDNPEIRCVDGEDIYNIEDGNTHHKMKLEHFTHEFYAIPITIEWLQKFGFKDYDNWEVFILNFPDPENLYDKPEICLCMNWKDGKGVVDGTFHFNDMLMFSPCLYVHQLQNLYYALTGTELELKK